MVSIAEMLRRLLEAEGATFHPSLKALSLPAMGGGVGMIAHEKIKSETTLAILPLTSMLTTRKARHHLALAEVALRSFHESPEGGGRGLLGGRELCFTAELLDSFPNIAHNEGGQYPSDSKYSGGFHFQDAVQETVDKLKEQLSPSETMTSHIVLMASLYRNVNINNTTAEKTKFKEEANPMNLESLNHGSSVDNRRESSVSVPIFRYQSENAWMQDWMNALPPVYNNLLELSNGFNQMNPSDSYLQEFNKLSSEDSDLQTSPLWFARHRAKVAYEKSELFKRYQHCLDVLLCLRELPIGVNEEENTDVRLAGDKLNNTSNNFKGKSIAFARKGVSCTLSQFLWAFNTLMSRGFAFDEEVWAMMPWVDYFNYALHANCTMFTQRCSSHKINDNNNDDLQNEASTSSDDEIDSNPSSSVDRLEKEGVPVRSFPMKRWEYVFQTISPIEPGEQVCICYGSYSDFECLLWYGFIQRPYLLPSSVLPFEPPRDLQSFLLFPNTKTARLFLSKASLNVEELSRLHASIPRLQDESFRQFIFESFWKQRMTSFISDNKNKTGGKLEYERWRSALQKAFEFVFSPLQDADGMFLELHKRATWMDGLVNDYLKTPPASSILTFENLPDSILMLKEKSMHLDKRCRCFAGSWQSFLRGVVSNSLPTTNATTEQKCTLGVFGTSFQMQRWIQCIARECWSQVKSKKPFSCTRGRQEILSLPFLSSLQDAKIFVLRAIAWMELYSNYSIYEQYFQGEGTAVNTKEKFALDMIHRSSDSEVGVFFSPQHMAQRASLDMWLLMQYLALEASDTELLSYLDFRND